MFSRVIQSAAGLVRRVQRGFRSDPGLLWPRLVVLMLFAILILMPGCVGPSPLRGGAATAGYGAASLTQPENPAAASAQTRSVSNVIEWAVPARVVGFTATATNSPSAASAPAPPTPPPAPVMIRQVTTERTEQTLGAAQEDTSREIAAKLASMRPVQFVGIALLLLALAMFHPVVFAVVGSRSTQMFTAAGGLLLIFGPQLVAGNETLILIAVPVVVALWWLARRYGEKDGLLKILTDK